LNIFSLLVIVTVIILSPLLVQNAFAQYSAGGVDLDGTWYVGEGLNVGDYYSYRMCYVDYLDCSEFVMSFWVEKEFRSGTEDKYLFQVLVEDGKKVIKGSMEVGQVAPEPTGGTDNISPYRSAYKSSIAWLSAYATKEIGDLTGKGPKDFGAPSWGKIANIGGEQILPTALETVKTPADTFDTVLIQWKTGGAKSNVWIVDEFPFPVKAKTFVHVAEGVPPVAYEFELLDYKYYITSDPFKGIETTASKTATLGCPKNYEKKSLNEQTNTYSMIVDIKYGPTNPKSGCDIEWFIDFKRIVNPKEFVSQVHYDIAIYDDPSKPPLRTVAGDEGRTELFTTAGQTHRFTTVEEPSGSYKYAIIVYGIGPEHIKGGDPSSAGLVVIDIDVGKGSSSSTVTSPSSSDSTAIPGWIKNNAEWWSQDQIDDKSFVTGIQYLINKDIMKIPPTAKGTGTGSDEIPSWIKNNAGWWAEGQIDDKSFVTAIQWLITNGIIKLG